MAVASREWDGCSQFRVEGDAARVNGPAARGRDAKFLPPTSSESAENQESVVSPYTAEDGGSGRVGSCWPRNTDQGPLLERGASSLTVGQPPRPSLTSE